MNIGWKDKNGIEIKLGDKISYYELYQCHSDAVDYFDVEPQNNYSVHEVYIEKNTGVVEYSRCAFRVNGRVLSDLGRDVSGDIFDCYFNDALGCNDIRQFIFEEYERLGISGGLSKLVKEIEII